MFRPLGKRDALAAMIIFGLVMLTTYQTLRMRVTYRNENDLVLLREDVQALHRNVLATQANLRMELDDIERTLYAQPVQKTEQPVTRRPSALEEWQANSFRELRDRITRIERRLYDIER